MRRYRVINLRTGREFIRRGKSKARVEKRLGSSVSHRDDYVVKRLK